MKINTETIVKVLSIISVIVTGIGECLKQFNKANENAKEKKVKTND